jgi:hypothetical protein
MRPGDIESNRKVLEPDPIHGVRCVPAPSDPLRVEITIELAEHVPACCLNVESAFVEFHGQGHHVKAPFTFRESRPGHLLEASLHLPAPGLYSYRIVGKILGRTLAREGSFEALSHL